MRTSVSFLPILSILAFISLNACGDEHDHNNEHSGDQVKLEFSALIDGQKADCNTEYTLGINDAKAKLADARIFISAVEYRNMAGDWVAMKLMANDWQHENVALLDFEDGTGSCKDSGTAEMHNTIDGMLMPGTYDKVRFSLGLPFELNHIDNATAPSPMNAPGMFWVWLGGYKFMRVDWIVTGADLPRFNTHLGSTHCMSDSPTTPPEERCGNHNMAKLEFNITSQLHNQVSLDLNKLVGQSDLQKNKMESPPGCMSSPMEPEDCGGIFTALGMTFADGKCENDCSDQTVFSLTGHH